MSMMWTKGQASPEDRAEARRRKRADAAQAAAARAAVATMRFIVNGVSVAGADLVDDCGPAAAMYLAGWPLGPVPAAACWTGHGDVERVA